MGNGDEVLAAIQENITQHTEIVLDLGIIDCSMSQEIMKIVNISIANHRSLYVREFCSRLEL